MVKRGETVIGELVEARDARGETWTHYFRREDLYSRIDYLMASPGLQVALPRAGARIYDGPGQAEGSDHRPVIVELDLNPAK
jgi:exonuclease III